MPGFFHQVVLFGGPLMLVGLISPVFGLHPLLNRRPHGIEVAQVDAFVDPAQTIYGVGL